MANLLGDTNSRTLPSIFAPEDAPPDQIPMINPPADPNMIPMIRGAAPNVTNPRLQQEQGLQQRISDFEAPKPSPHGFWGKTGHILSTIGNIAGDIFAPETMALIPGTQLHGQMQHGRDIRELQGLENEDQAEQNAASKRGLEGAQAGEANARADALENPPEKEANLQHLETDQGIFAFNPKTKELTPLTANGKPLQPFQKEAKEEGPTTEIQRDLLDAEKAGDKGRIDKDKQELKDLNPAAEQRFAFQVSQAGDRENRAGEKQDIATRQAAFKAYSPAMDSAERFNVMAKNYEDAVKNHDQQAMLSLLANHLGMTMGLQKGSRLTKDIIQEAIHSRPYLQGMGTHFDKDGYLDGVTLSQPQMLQMVNLGRERFAEDISKAGNEARYMGATDNGPERTPNKSVINHYLGLAGGDVNKAKALAAQDGWTVK